MRSHVVCGKVYVNGCTIGVLAWFYERFPLMATPVFEPIIPRMVCWQCKHSQLQECRADLKKLRDYDLVQFGITPREQKFTVDMVETPAEVVVAHTDGLVDELPPRRKQRRQPRKNPDDETPVQSMIDEEKKQGDEEAEEKKFDEKTDKDANPGEPIQSEIMCNDL